MNSSRRTSELSLSLAVMMAKSETFHLQVLRLAMLRNKLLMSKKHVVSTAMNNELKLVS